MRAPTAVVLLFALVACGADSTSPDMTSASGDYALRTVNNFPLPVTVLTQTNLKLEILSETLYVKPSGTFSDVTHYRRTTAEVVDTPADTLSGTWSVKGTVVTFIAGNSTFTGTMGGVSILIEGDGLAFRYIK